MKKGLLWQQRDKLFSRWKERYFILTKDYFHCFKKATSRITEMGGFIFKVRTFFSSFIFWLVLMFINDKLRKVCDNRCYNHILVVAIKKGLRKTFLLMSYLSLNVTFLRITCFSREKKISYKVMPFDFQLKLTEVETIELLDKRGYLTICISLIKDGKIYLRRPEGIRDWFTALQVRNAIFVPCIMV